MKDRSLLIDLVVLVACIVVLVAVPELVRFRLPLASAGLLALLAVDVYRWLFKPCAMREQTAQFAREELKREDFEHASLHLQKCSRCTSHFGKISKKKMQFEGRMA